MPEEGPAFALQLGEMPTLCDMLAASALSEWAVDRDRIHAAALSRPESQRRCHA